MRVAAISYQRPALKNSTVSHKGVKGALLGSVAAIGILSAATYCTIGNEPFKKCDSSFVIGSALLGTLGGGLGHFYEHYRKYERNNNKE